MGIWRRKSAAAAADARREDLKRDVALTAHREDLESELLPRLGTDREKGLTAAAARAALAKHGPNQLTPPRRTPVWVRFLRELTGFFSLLLWGGAALCFVGYALDRARDHLFLGVTLVFVVVTTGIFSFVQNATSENLMAGFRDMLPPRVRVVRDGTPDEVAADRVVPGDVVLVSAGDLVPADLRVLDCSDDLRVDNAALTGESEPQRRRATCTHDDPLETQNLCFFGESPLASRGVRRVLPPDHLRLTCFHTLAGTQGRKSPRAAAGGS